MRTRTYARFAVTLPSLAAVACLRRFALLAIICDCLLFSIAHFVTSSTSAFADRSLSTARGSLSRVGGLYPSVRHQATSCASAPPSRLRDFGFLCHGTQSADKVVFAARLACQQSMHKRTFALHGLPQALHRLAGLRLIVLLLLRRVAFALDLRHPPAPAAETFAPHIVEAIMMWTDHTHSAPSASSPISALSSASVHLTLNGARSCASRSSLTTSRRSSSVSAFSASGKIASRRSA